MRAFHHHVLRRGEQGYIYLAYGANTCDITHDPTWTVVALI